MRSQSQDLQYCKTPSKPPFQIQRLQPYAQTLQPFAEKLQPQTQKPQYRIQKPQYHPNSTVLRSQLLRKRFDEKVATSEKQQHCTGGSLQQPSTDGLLQQPPKEGSLKREADYRSLQNKWYNDPAFIMEAKRTELAGYRIMRSLRKWQTDVTDCRPLRDVFPDIRDDYERCLIGSNE
ncbi:hypothetical protein ACMFMG_012104 [Clarireedia jacksonii]